MNQFVTGDFNNDGHLDFAVEEGNVVEVLVGDGQGHFTSTGKFSEGELNSFSNVMSLAVGDFNGDFLDVAGPDGADGNTIIFLGNGDGTLAPPTFFSGGSILGSVAADFNGDHRIDLALSGSDDASGRGGVLILTNNTPIGSSDVSFGSTH